MEVRHTKLWGSMSLSKQPSKQNKRTIWILYLLYYSYPNHDVLLFMSLEGFPPTMEYSEKSLHNTHPPAIIVPFLI